MELIRYRSDEAEEWAALYVDGKLDYVGDQYNVDERIATLAGVVDRRGDFLLGGNSRDDAAQTVDKITEYESAKEDRLRQAEALKEQARALIAEAEALEKLAQETK